MKAIAPGMICWVAAVAAIHGSVSAEDSYQSSEDFAKYARKLRERALLKMEPALVIPVSSRPLHVSGRYPWKTGIVTTTFWIGEPGGGTKAPRNISTAWDSNWLKRFGGYDSPNPASRRNFIPANFVPRQNPFYIALPYNDLAKGATKPEAKVVIPWFHDAFVAEGKSVCRDRWLAVRNSAGQVCYAQWSDCGPYRSDHWQYVFGNEEPEPNANRGAGLNISPAVRDFLGLRSTDVTDWKFVEFKDVPKGPWSLYGDNNHFVQQKGRAQEPGVRVLPAPPAPPVPNDTTIIPK